MSEPLCRPVALAHDHPAFEGHFPNQPLLPGVVLLGEVLEMLLRENPRLLAGTPRVSVVKFLAPVRPGARLDLRCAPPAAGRVRFEVWRHGPGDPAHGVLAASGQLEGEAS
jgi:3-hydroxymyristoyl/3-hydroxydecanoyl-(acyl carrier protein) dehydratase